jgi:cysteine desulfurase
LCVFLADIMDTASDIIYLDHNATTPVAPEVLEKMLPYFSSIYGNAASSTHTMGRRAKDAVDHARQSLADMLGAHEEELSFTSGATEGINTALKGLFWRYSSKGKHFITLPTEHKAVLDTLQWLEKQGAEISYLPVDSVGQIDLDELKKSIRKDTVAVVAMWANNETGTILPVKTIAEVVHERNSIFVCDATQAAGKVEVNVTDSGVDVLVLSAHKMYGPKGVGMLYLRRRGPRVTLEPLFHGGGHERGVRSGTLNVPGIVGLGHCAALSGEMVSEYDQNVRMLRNDLWHFLQTTFHAQANADVQYCLPNTLNVRLPGIKATSVIRHFMGQVAISTGSACSSENQEPSHVLSALGLSPEEAGSSLRFSLGLGNTVEEINRVKNLLTQLKEML